MWMLVKDHLRRNWKSLTLMTLVFAYFAGLMMRIASLDLDLTRSFPQLLPLFYSTIYMFYAMLVSRFWMNNDLNFIRFSRTLPFRESTLANLVWSMAVLAPPVFTFVIVLLLGCLAFCFGKAHSLPIASPLLFLLLATLLSGVLAFVKALLPQVGAPLSAGHHMQRSDAVSASYLARILLAVACAVTVIVLLIYPTPTRWSDLTPRHLAGMGLAAWLTWKSYRLRYRLLQSELPRNAIRRSPKLERHLKSKEIVLPHYGSVPPAVAQDLKIMLLASPIMILWCIGFGYLVQFCLAWSELVPRGGNFYGIITSVITAAALVMAIAAISMQFHRLSVLGAVRALPLTGNQCVLLFLSYPYALTLAVVPCIAAHLWLTGYGHFSVLLLGGILLSAGLCPFAMFLRARFGDRFIIRNVEGFFFLGLVGVLAFPAHLTPLSTPVICAGVLLLAVLGIVGYFGLRHLIENSSEIYKRKMFPRPFDQG